MVFTKYCNNFALCHSDVGPDDKINLKRKANRGDSGSRRKFINSSDINNSYFIHCMLIPEKGLLPV